VADLNDDGIDDLFLSTTGSDQDNSGAGKWWDIYISKKNGTYF
jgi:hypothetical protein